MSEDNQTRYEKYKPTIMAYLKQNKVCEICNKTMKLSSWYAHIKSTKHIIKQIKKDISNGNVNVKMINNM